MTRTELYTLVWSKPMIHLAREFGLSDVGLRKICVKHSIPTPPLGYWAKLAHGKPVKQTPLPPPNDGTPESFYLVPRPSRELPPHLLPIHAAAVEYQAALENAIIVLDERPEKLHRIAAAVEKALRKAKPDGNGFLNVDGKELPEVMVGP